MMPALAARPDLPFAVEMPMRLRRGPDAQPVRAPDPVPLLAVEAAVRDALADLRRWLAAAPRASAARPGPQRNVRAPRSRPSKPRGTRMKRIAFHILAAAAVALGVAAAEAQTPGGQTGGTGGGTGSASSNGGQGDAGGTGQTGVSTLGSGRQPAGIPAAGASVGHVMDSPTVGAGATGNGGIMSGTSGTDATPSGSGSGSPKGGLDGIASGKAPD